MSARSLMPRRRLAICLLGVFGMMVAALAYRNAISKAIGDVLTRMVQVHDRIAVYEQFELLESDEGFSDVSFGFERPLEGLQVKMQDDAIYSLATLIPTELSAYCELRVEYDGFDGETKLTLEGEGMKFYFSNGRPLGGVITSHSRTKFNFGTTEFSSLPIAKDLLYDRIGEPQSWRRERSSLP